MDTTRLGTPSFSPVRRGAAAVLGAAILAAAPTAVATGTGPPISTQASAPSGRAAPSHEIDTSDRTAVAEAWRTRMADNLDVPSGWTGEVDGCEAGKPSADAQKATLESINFVRAMAGLDAVVLRADLSKQAQKAALIMTANDALSHDPPRSWRCWNKTGAEAAGRSNLAWTSGKMKAGQAVELYLDDSGANNRAAGHRRWVLNPFASAMGNGLTSTADALYVLGPADAEATNPDWVSWPTRGWFPSPLQPGGRWSLSAGSSSADFSKSTVSVKRGSKALKVNRFKPHTGYAQPTLVFQVKGLKATGTYRVAVRHVEGAAAGKYAWTVRLFTP